MKTVITVLLMFSSQSVWAAGNACSVVAATTAPALQANANGTFTAVIKARSDGFVLIQNSEAGVVIAKVTAGPGISPDDMKQISGDEVDATLQKDGDSYVISKIIAAHKFSKLTGTLRNAKSGYLIVTSADGQVSEKMVQASDAEVNDNLGELVGEHVQVKVVQRDQGFFVTSVVSATEINNSTVSGVLAYRGLKFVLVTQKNGVTKTLRIDPRDADISDNLGQLVGEQVSVNVLEFGRMRTVTKVLSAREVDEGNLSGVLKYKGTNYVLETTGADGKTHTTVIKAKNGEVNDALGQLVGEPVKVSVTTVGRTNTVVRVLSAQEK